MIWWSTNGQQGFAQIDVISDHALVFGTFCNPKHEAKILRANTPYDNSHLAYVGVVRTLSRCKTLAIFILKTWMKQKKEIPTFAKCFFHFCIPCCFTNLSCYTYVILCYATRDGWCLKELNPCLTCAKSRFLWVFGKKGTANLEFTKLTCNPTDELKVKKLPCLIHWSVLSPT